MLTGVAEENIPAQVRDIRETIPFPFVRPE
jgi:hypothetical protein